MTVRIWLMIGVAVPIIGILGLLVWASLPGYSQPTGLNRDFKAVAVEPRAASDFNLTTMDGRNISLADFKGKIVLIDFWASWCEPCRYEAQLLNDGYNAYSNNNVEFIGINIWDNESPAESFVEEFSVPYANGIDVSGNIAINYGVAGVPEKYFIDQYGYIQKKFRGPISEEILSSTIDEMLSDGSY